jgi:hypothetical protein
LSRTSSHRVTPAHPAARALPHELWLARALGLLSNGQPGFATAAMRGYGLEPREGTWFMLHPAHIDIAHSHLQMADLRHLDLAEDDARALFEAARPSFDEAGYALEYGDANTWFMRADDWAGMDTASPDAAVGMNLTDWMPTGPRARAFRKLQNEVQMVWFAHSASDARAARRQSAVNAFWPWAPAKAVPAHAGTQTAPPKPASTPAVATFETQSWLSALGTRKVTTLAQAITTGTLLVCGNVAAPAIAADWSGWLQQMQRLEAELFAPALAALMRGEIAQLQLVLSHRGAAAEFTTTALAQRKFWRRPTLERLL